MIYCTSLKPVRVRAHYRVSKLGKRFHVREHCRRRPHARSSRVAFKVILESNL